MKNVKLVFVSVVLSLLVTACGAEDTDKVYVISPDTGSKQSIYLDKGDTEYIDITEDLSEIKSEHKSAEPESTSSDHESICQVSPNTLNRFPAFGVNEDLKCHSFETLLERGIDSSDGKVIQYKYQGKTINENFEKSHAYECSEYSLYCYGANKSVGTQYVIKGCSDCSSTHAAVLPIKYVLVGNDFQLEGGVTPNSSVNDVIALYGEGELDSTDSTILLTYYVKDGGSICFIWDSQSSSLSCVNYIAE